MPQLRLALAQINPTVGDLAGNVDRVVARAHEARRPAPTSSRSRRWSSPATRSRTSRCAPRSRTRAAAALDALATRLADEGLGGLVVVVGYLDRVADAGAAARHARAARRRTPRRCSPAGRVVARYAKHHLPNYGVFDEYRYFVPGRGRRSSG